MFSSPGVLTAEEIWTVRDGSTVVSLDLETLAQLGLEVGPPVNSGATDDGSGLIFFVDPASTLTFAVESGSISEFLGGRVIHQDGLRLTARRRSISLDNLIVTQVRGPAPQPYWAIEGPSGATAGLISSRVKAGFNTSSQTLTIHGPDFCISPDLAGALGNPSLAGVVLGKVTILAAAEWVGGDEPEQTPAEASSHGGPSELRACDMTFCELYGLLQFGRLDDIVGLALATTSWNIGFADCIWFSSPDPEHPFIVMNLFRLKDDRFEQIGQSWVKHGFYALGSHQCGGPPCSYQPGHGAGDWLGQNCTDTYGASLNAGPGSLRPRHEVNPWTGVWIPDGSPLRHGGHSHTPISHRIQVHDADLDPDQNPGATYYAEGYYVMLDDINVMNSASWKPITISGTPGGTWSFGMSGYGTLPTAGFALDAWSDAVLQTTLAQEVPPVEFVSPDGRCILSAKPTDLGGTWHYEYALLNIDMDRKVDSFTIPLAPSAVVTNVGFHAVEHHDEEDQGYSNDAWTWQVADGAITWSTLDNPVRWGTMYNFRFDADAAPNPDGTVVTLGMFEPGEPDVLTGETIGPCIIDADGDMDGNGQTDGADISAFTAAVASGSIESGDLCPADFDHSGALDMADVPYMVSALLAP
jgi:hypothetical protein